MRRKEIEFCEADPSDAQAFIHFMQQVASETDFLVMDETGFAYHQEQMKTIFAAGIENPREIHLLAKLENEVIGAITVKSSKQFRISILEISLLQLRKNIGVMELALYS